MVTIVVAGSSSRAGKTALAETVLRGLGSRAAAVKFTTTDDIFEKCPRGTSCIVCDIDVPFKVVRDEATLGEAGTDTARLRAATKGAVLWTITRRSVVELAFQATVRLLNQARADSKMPASNDGLVIEGSTIAGLCAPDFTFFVVHPFLRPDRLITTQPARPMSSRVPSFLGHLKTSEVGDVLEHAVRRIERHGPRTSCNESRGI